MSDVIPSNVTDVVEKVKAGIRTTEFYLSLFVVIAGVAVPLLPVAQATPLVKAVALVTALLTAMGYTASRTLVKTKQQ